ncbi:hypothetical protein [Burkholderia gladioli]|uniref:hypothetical protein n=1 Tax=Burkholderia gladioli TaxID=28095 RepID=UPI000DCF9376|nr:hypothetical protein [Burkholderia gladioli]
MKVYQCRECGNTLSKTAKECGNPSCKSSDPFGKEAAIRRRQVTLVILLISVVGSFATATHFGIITPQDIHDFGASIAALIRPH